MPDGITTQPFRIHPSSLKIMIHKTYYVYLHKKYIKCVYVKPRAEKKQVPETKNTEEGSARRNITRKHDHDPHK